MLKPDLAPTDKLSIKYNGGRKISDVEVVQIINKLVRHNKDSKT